MLISNQRLINWQPFKQNALEDKRGWDRFIFFRSGSPMSCNVGRTVVNPCSPQMAWPGLAWPGHRSSDVNVPSVTLKKAHWVFIALLLLITHTGMNYGLAVAISSRSLACLLEITLRSAPVLSRADSVLSSPRLSPNNFHHPERRQSREFSSGYCPILSASDAPDEMCATYPWGVKRNHLIITFTSLPQLHGQGGVSADWPDSCSASDRVLRQRHTHSAVPRWLSFSPLPWPVHL